ncbi:radical SAM protein [Bacillota bacterium]
MCTKNSVRKEIRRTYSVCPVCLKRIPAVQAAYGREVYLEKTCPEHGDFSAILWRGFVDMEAWREGCTPIAEGENENCPHGCGLCPDHRQGTCCVLLEVTKRCNLNCAFCFAEGGSGEDIPFETVCRQLKKLAVPGETLVQLSGGEPTMRDDLPKIVAAAKDAGCRYVQLNTNGIRLAESLDYVRSLAEAGLSFVFMQFDGTKDGIYEKLRGEALFDLKKKAIENCDRCNIGVTLVPTLVPGVNISDIGNIIKFAVSQAPAVRGVHFQPVSYFGRMPDPPVDDMRFTLDELLKEIDEQAGDIIPPDSISHSRCNHPMCGFHGDYIAMGGHTLYPLRKAAGDCACCNTGNQKGVAIPDTEGFTAEEKRSYVARKWKRPESVQCCPSGGSVNIGQDKCGCNSNNEEAGIDTLEGFLKRMQSHSFTITAMAFQDAGNIDLERLRRCSLHVYDDGRHVPFCAYYLSGHG